MPQQNKFASYLLLSYFVNCFSSQYYTRLVPSQDVPYALILWHVSYLFIIGMGPILIFFDLIALIVRAF